MVVQRILSLLSDKAFFLNIDPKHLRNLLSHSQSIYLTNSSTHKWKISLQVILLKKHLIQMEHLITLDNITNTYRESRNMQRRGRESWERRKALKKNPYKRLTRFSQSQMHRVAVAFRTISFACPQALTVHEVSTCAGSVSSKDQLFPSVFFLSSLLAATAKGEVGYEADLRSSFTFCVLEQVTSKLHPTSRHHGRTTFAGSRLWTY